MSIIRSLAVFILSSIFTLALFIAITSYNFGSMIGKESVEGLIYQEGTVVVDQRCGDFCSNGDQNCFSDCKSKVSNQTAVGEFVDEFYSKQIVGGMSLDALSGIASNYLLFFIVTAALGALLIFTSKSPLSTLGKDFVWSSAYLLASGFFIGLILSSIEFPFGIGSDVKSYLSPGLNGQTVFGIVLLAAGAALILANHFLKKKSKVVQKEIVSYTRPTLS